MQDCAPLALFYLDWQVIMHSLTGYYYKSTTSTQNSGLYDVLLPAFTAQTGIDVHVIAVGTGKALANGRNCNGDALLIHSKKDEETFCG